MESSLEHTFAEHTHNEHTVGTQNVSLAGRVYSAASGAGEGDSWFEIGLAYPQADGSGMIILLQAQPLNPTLLLRYPAEGPPDGSRRSLAQQVEAFERAVIERCLSETGGRINVVTQLLKVPRRTLSEKMARLG